MKNITLERLIYNNYLKTSLASIIFIELVLVIIYFLVNNHMIDKSIDFILSDLKKNTYTLVNEKTSSINKKLDDVESLIKIVQKEHEDFFSNKISLIPKEKIEFKYAPNGMYYKTLNNGGSSVVVSRKTKIDEKLKKELQESEVFDITFKTIIDHDEDFIAVYFNSYKDYNRYYPFLENVYDVFPPEIKMQDYNFFYLADKNHNPGKNVVWTDVYLDPAKKGWLISAIAPIYDNNEKLQGVSGIDITLNNFLKSFLDIDLPYNGQTLVVNSDQKIIAMQEELEKLFKSKTDNTYHYKNDEKIFQTIYKNEDINLDNPQFLEFSKLLKNLITGNEYSHQIKIKNKDYIVFTKKIDKPSWYVVSIIERDKILENVNMLEKDYKLIGISMIVLIVIFYLIFFIFLSRKAKDFVFMIDKPLKEIISLSKKLLLKENIDSIKPTGIIELDKLTTNFNELSSQLDVRTKKLVEEESKRIYHEKLANTDSLTGCYNRRYLNNFAEEYLKILKREKYLMSIMMLDLDDFKYINDSYGHELGDKVLRDFSKLIKDSIRENDLVVRLGGDEFLVLLPNTSIDDSYIVAQKILKNLDIYNINKKFEVKTSIGLSKYENDVSISTIISRADDALYRAKKAGKNCIL